MESSNSTRPSQHPRNTGGRMGCECNIDTGGGGGRAGGGGGGGGGIGGGDCGAGNCGAGGGGGGGGGSAGRNSWGGLEGGDGGRAVARGPRRQLRFDLGAVGRRCHAGRA